MEIKKSHIIGIAAAIVLVTVDFLFFLQNKIFYFLLAISFILASSFFVASTIAENRREKENNEMFLEFSRNLVESVKAGTPISKGIVNLRDKYYGTLTGHIQKLANQVSIGIPLKAALETFSEDVDSKIVKRAVTLISEAEKAGGEIEGILASVAESLGEIEALKKEREAAIYSLVVQGYIIFFIFIAIMLIMQFKIMPMTSELSNTSGLEGYASFGGGISAEEISKPMFYLLIVQGLFTGLVIGKLASGSFKSGIKHSFIMIAISLIVYSLAKIIF